MSQYEHAHVCIVERIKPIWGGASMFACLHYLAIAACEQMYRRATPLALLAKYLLAHSNDMPDLHHMDAHRVHLGISD